LPVGRREEAETVRDEMLSMAAQSYVKTYFLAMAHLAFGTEPKLDSQRKDERFIELFRATRNPIALK